MKILRVVIISGVTISLMEIVYFYSTNHTWVEFIFAYGESGDAKPKKKDARVQTSMYDIFYFRPIMHYISLLII